MGDSISLLFTFFFLEDLIAQAYGQIEMQERKSMLGNLLPFF